MLPTAPSTVVVPHHQNHAHRRQTCPHHFSHPAFLYDVPLHTVQRNFTMLLYRLYTHNIVPSGGRACHNLARYRRKLGKEGKLRGG